MIFDFADGDIVSFGDRAFVVTENGDLAICFGVGGKFVDYSAVFGGKFSELILESVTCVERTEYFRGETRHQFPKMFIEGSSLESVHDYFIGD